MNVTSTKSLSTLLLKLFLFLVFFVYYQTILLPGTLHSWILMLGFGLTLPRIMYRSAKEGYSLPYDYTLVLGLVVLLVLSFVANFGDTTLSQLQAYLLALVCYVFVRENMPDIAPSFIRTLLFWFLLINSIFVILQFYTGEFFPARYLAAGDPPLMLPSGVSDGPTKNGMLQAFALSVFFARFIAGVEKVKVLEIVTFVIGVAALILSASRAGLAAFILAVPISVGLLMLSRKRAAQKTRRSRKIVYVFLVLLMALFVRVITSFTQFIDPHEYSYAASVIAFKLSQREDDSIGERFITSSTALSEAVGNPIQLLGVGFGVGSFEKTVGINLHNSYIEFLFEAGLLGAILLWSLVFHVVRKALKSGQILDALPFIAGLISIMGFMAFHDVLRGRTFWIPLAIVGSIAYGRMKVPGRTHGQLVSGAPR